MRKLTPLMRAASSESLPEADSWIDRELLGCQFKDVRLFQRFRKLLGQIASAVGQTIPFVCQDWANTKAAYRFFSNERVDEAAIVWPFSSNARSSYEGRWAALGSPRHDGIYL
jgi:Transposase DNA-binding